MDGTTAIKTINKWIAHAHSIKAVPHLRHFFIARDILEGKVSCPPYAKRDAVEWIRENTRHSADKAVLMSALDARMKGGQ